MGKQPSASTIPSRQLGRQLRELRQGAGLTIERAAQLIGRGATTLQRLEKGEASVVRINDIENLSRTYDAIDQLDDLKAMADEANNGAQDWWHRCADGLRDNFGTYLSLEASASKLTLYQPILCPGLVQTADYARAIYQLADIPCEEIRAGVEARNKRKKLFTRQNEPTPVDIVIEEFVLRRPIGGPAVMANQARYLADLPANVEVHMIPLGTPYPLWGSVGSFNLLDFPNEPSIVFIEHHETDIYYERPRIVHTYRNAFTKLKNVALTTADTKLALRKIAKEYKA